MNLIFGGIVSIFLIAAGLLLIVRRERMAEWSARAQRRSLGRLAEPTARRASPISMLLAGFVSLIGGLILASVVVGQILLL